MAPIADIILIPPAFASAVVFRLVRRIGLQRLPLIRKIIIRTGIFPLRRHYYEPLFDPRELRKSLRQDRDLPGIDWNDAGQIELLQKFNYSDELQDVPEEKSDRHAFFWNNKAFISGDAEYLYNLIRLMKPKVMIEIGSGFSTLIAIRAIRKNQDEDPGYLCEHICIEPYEQPWLESLGIRLIREKVEEIGKEIFDKLHENDILFIDSSHIIRPQGDVLFEYLEILPRLGKGVIVHAHDIFSPKDYPDSWIIRGETTGACFFNEQYLLEAFLTSNPSWRIIGAVNYLHHKYPGELKTACPRLIPENEPGSFYMMKMR